MFVSDWTNIGTAPSYKPRTLIYRLRGESDEVDFKSGADVRTWLPGTHRAADTIEIPENIATGTYSVDVAVITPAGTEPVTNALPLRLGIEGRLDDGFYHLSTLSVE